MKTKDLPPESLILYISYIALSSLSPGPNNTILGSCKLDGGYCVNGQWDKPLNRPDKDIPLISETVPMMQMIDALAVRCGKTSAEMVTIFGGSIEDVLAAKGAIPPAALKP